MSAEINGNALNTPPSKPLAPNWLQPSIFENLLKSKFVNFSKITQFSVLPALGPGENYATVMLRVHIDFELSDGITKNITYMLKVPHDNELSSLLAKEHNIFDVERGMYRDVVPEMEALYRNVGLELKFGADAYILENIASDNILLEDLRQRGFKNANRLDCLDMTHTKAVLKKLAQWHAATAHRVATVGKYDDMYRDGYFSEKNRATLQQINDNLAKYIIQCMEIYEGNETYIEDVKKILPHQTDLTIKFGKNDPNEFHVLNHGDCWSNNIMFQHDAFGNIKETYFVDFQVPKYGTPAQDLFHFLISSTQLEIKLKEFDYFIKYYHDQLIEHLKLLKYPKKLPTLSAIHIVLYKYGFFGYCTATMAMAGVLLDPTENSNLNNFMSDSDTGTQLKLEMYSNKRYRRHIQAILPWLHNRGAFEI